MCVYIFSIVPQILYYSWKIYKTRTIFEKIFLFVLIYYFLIPSLQFKAIYFKNNKKCIQKYLQPSLKFYKEFAIKFNFQKTIFTIFHKLNGENLIVTRDQLSTV